MDVADKGDLVLFFLVFWRGRCIFFFLRSVDKDKTLGFSKGKCIFFNASGDKDKKLGFSKGKCIFFNASGDKDK
jgi:hypothetical protein